MKYYKNITEILNLYYKAKMYWQFTKKVRYYRHITYGEKTDKQILNSKLLKICNVRITNF